MGLPGTKGQLIIVTESQITGQDLVLFIDFKLANCPVGYCPPKVTDRLKVRVVMCVCLCMYVCVCVCMCACVCMHVCACCMYIHMYRNFRCKINFVCKDHMKISYMKIFEIL